MGGPARRGVHRQCIPPPMYTTPSLVLARCLCTFCSSARTVIAHPVPPHSATPLLCYGLPRRTPCGVEPIRVGAICRREKAHEQEFILIQTPRADCPAIH